MNKLVLLIPMLVLLAACDENGQPNTDTEVWAIVIIFLGLFATVAFIAWLCARFE